jgi:CHAT domain-containing protein
MEDFNLALLPLQDGYQVRADCRPVGQTTRTISPADGQHLLALGARLQARPLREISEAVEVGRSLFRHLFGTDIAQLLREAQGKTQDHGGLRLLLRFTAHDPMQDLPWELLHDGSWPLALNPATALARYIEMPRPVMTPRVRGLRVLLTTACPPDAPALDLGTEVAKVRALRAIPGIDVTIQSQVTLRLLRRLLTRAENVNRPFYVWHHAGHGLLDPAGVRLCLEGGDRAGTAEIVPILTSCPNLLAVVFNVCHGAALAAEIARENVPVAIGFQERILDLAALAFAQRFYQSVLNHPIEVALTHSRLALAYQGNPRLNWTNPRLYTRTTSAVRIGERP